MSTTVRIGDELRELLNNRLIEVTEDPREVCIAQHDAETMNESVGIEIVPLRLHFENGQTLVCYVAGWSIERP